MKAPQGVETSVTIEVGPVIFYGATQHKAELAAKRAAREMEQRIRDYFSVGRRNPVVACEITTTPTEE